MFEAEYAAQMSESMGAPAKPFRMALGALIIKVKFAPKKLSVRRDFQDW
jgi:hypothetical protein